MSPFLIAIIAANAVLTYKGLEDTAFFNKYKFDIRQIKAGEKHRFFTSAFLHADWMHFGFNMLTLYFFAPIVISYFGPLYFLIIYFVSLVLGNVFSYQINKDNNFYTAIGASGAVTGILYSAILMVPDQNLYLFFAIPIPAYLFGIGYLFYSIYGMKAQRDNIGHEAHFGGAVGGYLITLALMPSLFLSETFFVAALFIPIVVLFFVVRNKK